MDDGIVRAAGGVVWRPAAGGAPEVLLVHRPRYDDWTFPKGKLDPGETWEQAAAREVHEETGIVPVLGDELVSTEYRDRHGRPKRVRYWSMAVGETTAFEPNDEVSGLLWVVTTEAAGWLTYTRDVPVLASFISSSP